MSDELELITEEKEAKADSESTATAVQPQRPTGPVDSEKTKIFREKFDFFGPVTLLYAIFYAICMYRNPSGVTFPFFVAGSLFYFYCSLTKLGSTCKKGTRFYAVIMMLLAISTFLTDDERIIIFNKMGIFLLVVSLLLNSFFDTEKWGLGKYVSSIFQSVFMCVGMIFRPFEDLFRFTKNKPEKMDKRVVAVGLGLVISLPLVLLVTALLSSADVFFRQITDKMVSWIDFTNVFSVSFMIIAMFFAVYCLTAYLCTGQINEEVKDNRKGEPLIAVTFTAMLTLIYMLFSGIQFFGLFLRQLTLPEGYSYAQYAREGFFQLLAVGFLNLVLVLVCLTFFRENKALKVILTLMSLCTLVMNASSAMRMIMYIEVYFLTFLRILVLWALLVLTLIFIGVIINIYKEDFKLFRYSMAVVSLLYVVLAFSRPDYLIAKYDVSRIASVTTAEQPGQFKDFKFLSELNADAAPVLVPFLKAEGYQVTGKEIYPYDYKKRDRDGFGYYWLDSMRHKTEDLGIRTFNLSRWYVKKMIK